MLNFNAGDTHMGIHTYAIRRATIGAIVFLCATPFAVRAAQTAPSCEQVLQECFAFNEKARAACIDKASKNESCTDSALSTLARERWAISPQEQAAPALTGPQLVDRSCLENFDNRWSSMLIAKEITNEEVEILRNELRSCHEQLPIDLPRL